MEEKKYTKQQLSNKLRNINYLLVEYGTNVSNINSTIRQVKCLIRQCTLATNVNTRIIEDTLHQYLIELRYNLKFCNKKIIELKNESRIYNKILNKYYNFWNTVPDFHKNREVEKHGKRINKHSLT